MLYVVQVGSQKHRSMFFFFFKLLSYSASSQNLAKSSYGRSPLWLHRKIAQKKPNMRSCCMMNQPLNYYPLSFIHPRRQTPQFIIQFLFVGAVGRATAEIGEMTKEEELRPRVCCEASKRCAKLRHVRLESLCCKCGGAADGQRRRIGELFSTIRDTFFSVFCLFFFRSVFFQSVEVVLLVVTTIHTQGFLSTDLHRKSCYQEYGSI